MTLDDLQKLLDPPQEGNHMLLRLRFGRLIRTERSGLTLRPPSISSLEDILGEEE